MFFRLGTWKCHKINGAAPIHGANGSIPITPYSPFATVRCSSTNRIWEELTPTFVFTPFPPESPVPSWPRVFITYTLGVVVGISDGTVSRFRAVTKVGRCWPTTKNTSKLRNSCFPIASLSLSCGLQVAVPSVGEINFSTNKMKDLLFQTQRRDKKQIEVCRWACPALLVLSRTRRSISRF